MYTRTFSLFCILYLSLNWIKYVTKQAVIWNYSHSTVCMLNFNRIRIKENQRYNYKTSTCSCYKVSVQSQSQHSVGINTCYNGTTRSINLLCHQHQSYRNILLYKTCTRFATCLPSEIKKD